MSVRRFRFMCASIAFAYLCGCALPPKSVVSLQPVSLARLGASEALGRNSGAPALLTDEQWSFGDRQLAMLMTRALADSPRYAQALARVRKAAAYVQSEQAANLPQISSDASLAGSKLSENSGYPPQFVPKGLHSNARLTLGLNWDTDLFGRNRAAVAAATSEAQAARFEADEAQLMLRTTVALAYSDFAGAVADMRALNEVTRLQDRVHALMTLRFRAGLEDTDAVSRADAALQQARTDAIAAAGQEKVARYRLAALVGQGPDFGATLTAPAFHVEGGLLDQLGADAIATRADVRGANAGVSAEAARVKMASRDFYPNLSLAALAGFQSIDVPQLLLGGSTIPSFGAALHLPIFAGGRLRSAYRSKQADYDAAVAMYNETLVDALQEASAAVTRVKTGEQGLVAAQAAYTDAQKVAGTARARVMAKLTSELPLLAALMAEARSRRAVDEADIGLTARRLALIRALGGRAITATNMGNQ